MRGDVVVLFISYLSFLAAGRVLVKRAVDSATEYPSSDKPVRGCYLTNWAQYRAAPYKWTVDEYQVGLCTHIFYAFAKVENGQAASTDSSDLQNGYPQLLQLKQKDPNLKTLLSFGGSTYANFPTDAQTPDAFCKTALTFAQDNGFDGIDIDWEFPTVDQKDLFTGLIKACKSAAGSLLISAAVSPNAETAAQIYDLTGLSDSLDLLNVMAYDFHGSWDTVTGANAPLYGDGEFTDDYLAQFYKKNFPAEKIVLGIPTYGRGWTLASSAAGQGMGASAPSASAAFAVTQTAGIGAYYEICPLGEGQFDETSQTPYVQKDNQWFTFDNAQSVTAKANYAKTNGFAGVFVWTLDFDDFSETCGKGKFPLLSAINVTLA